MSSSESRVLRLGPTKKSSTSTIRVPLTDAISILALVASSGGWASPAGEAVARLPATVPLLRICGEPMVRAAMDSAGQWLWSSSMIRE